MMYNYKHEYPEYPVHLSDVRYKITSQLAEQLDYTGGWKKIGRLFY